VFDLRECVNATSAVIVNEIEAEREESKDPYREALRPEASSRSDARQYAPPKLDVLRVLATR
jgi:hypothetical protein